MTMFLRIKIEIFLLIADRGRLGADTDNQHGCLKGGSKYASIHLAKR